MDLEVLIDFDMFNYILKGSSKKKILFKTYGQKN